MKPEYYKQVNDMFTMCPKLKDEFRELYEVITLILKSFDLQEQANEINKKLNELNSDKHE